MAKSKDLFDDSTMTFGEHLEVLRFHLWKAIIGLFACVILALFFGEPIVALVRGPIDRALKQTGQEAEDDLPERSFWETAKAMFTGEENLTEDEQGEVTDEENPQLLQSQADRATITVKTTAFQLGHVLHAVDAELFPNPPDFLKDKEVSFELSAPEFRELRKVVDDSKSPVTLTVQEAFVTYLKVSFVAGLVIASPWVIYQLWLFVAAGLYPHEKRYVYLYLPISIVLFLIGVVFCFFGVFPYVLQFLLSFNESLGVVPQIRLSEWISFAIMLPVMFGLSFQLPLVMLFLERISIFEANDYREKRRMAILVIAVLSMMLTPAEPTSMIMMMIPLLLLYEVGIFMCTISPAAKSPFEAETV